MPILNYTTSVAVEKTVGEIQRKLALAKATHILLEYGPQADVAAISFRVPTPYGLLSFRLPANVDRIAMSLTAERGIPKGLRTRKQAERVAWRIVKDWLEAQLALIEAGMAEMEQVFLPYAQDSTGITVYDQMKERRFATLALPQPK